VKVETILLINSSSLINKYIFVLIFLTDWMIFSNLYNFIIILGGFMYHDRVSTGIVYIYIYILHKTWLLYSIIQENCHNVRRFWYDKQSLWEEFFFFLYRACKRFIQGLFIRWKVIFLKKKLKFFLYLFVVTKISQRKIFFNQR